MTYDHITSSFGPKRISELLKRAPSDANTPEKLAELTGVPVDTITLMEKGDYEPTVHVACKLAAAFQVPLENLFVDDDDTKTTDGSQC
ncbi:MAG TPA: helix-turn-helix transcriptional regulator [Tepidisphaeraceae bacterium]|jgi:putative transcriptional regulator|nr:helix-turn-helix transcriptional regulator [Tepidisphaeraceae bacterium]